MKRSEQIRAFIESGGSVKAACLEFGISHQMVGQVMEPEKHAARCILAYWLKKNPEAKPKECQDCRTEAKIEAHHADYSQPLKVDWLCKKCHALRHIKPKPAPEPEMPAPTRAEISEAAASLGRKGGLARTKLQQKARAKSLELARKNRWPDKPAIKKAA